MLRTLADSIKLEQAAEDKILEAAAETLEEEPSPERTEKLKEVSKKASGFLNELMRVNNRGYWCPELVSLHYRPPDSVLS